MSNQLAVVRQPSLTIDDHSGKVVLTFDAYISEGGGALQVIAWPDIEPMLRDAKVWDIHQLDGKACWVDTDTPGIIRFVRMATM